MSPHSINLRSDDPAVLVEFDLPPETHATIGAALNAEISLPLAGLAEFAGVIGRTREGRLYLSDPDGENMRFIELPAAIPLPPYCFAAFHPSAATSQTIESPQSGGPVIHRLMAVAATCLAFVVVAGVIAVAVVDKPESIALPQNSTTQDHPPGKPTRAFEQETPSAGLIPDPPPTGPAMDAER